MKALGAFVSGLVFAAGLVVGGMTLPSNVLGFLDLSGTWKPALMFVMGGGIVVFSIGYRLVVKRGRPLLDLKFYLSEESNVDLKLVTGAAVFGIGWGLAGFCPGPALTAVGAGAVDALIFVPFMILGMILCRS